jgi:hypothetical protein
LAATNRPTSRSRIGSDGNALHNSLRGEDFIGSAMKHSLHILMYDATYDARAEAHGRKSCKAPRILVL